MAVTTVYAQEPDANSVSCIIKISADPQILDIASMPEDLISELVRRAAVNATARSESEAHFSWSPFSSSDTIWLASEASDEASAKASLGEFINAIESSLRQFSQSRAIELASRINSVQESRYHAQTELDVLLGQKPDERSIPRRLRTALDTTVDLSMWSPDMPFSEALDTLKNSVDPPLQIVAMWKDLLDSCNTDRSTPIDIDGLPSVKVGTALELLVKAMSTDMCTLGYQINDNVIVIEPAENLAVATQPVSQADAKTLTQRRDQIMRDIQTLELDLAGLEARRAATEEQIVRAQEDAQGRLANDVVTKELEKLVEMQTQVLERQRQEVEYGARPVSGLAEAQESLAKAKIELARRKEDLTWSASGGRLTNLSGQLSQIAIDRTEMGARLGVLKRHLADVEKEMAQIAAFEAKASQIQATKTTLEALDRKLAELRTEQASSRPPMVTVIGAN